MQMNLYAVTVDLILVAVFAITVYFGWKRGFVSAVSGILSLLGAWIISAMFGYLLFGVLQRNVFDPLVSDMIGNLIAGAMDAAESTADAAAQALASSLESIRSCTDIFGITVPLDADSLAQMVGGGFTDSAAGALTADIAAPISATLSEWTAHLLLFVSAYLILRLLFVVLNLVMKLPVLSGVNRMLGGLGGVILGIGYVFIASRLLAVILGILVTRGTLPPEVMGGTVFGFLTGTPSV